MRADRLISILMILQTRVKVTAEELSHELEVSQRTIYRDITALNSAGIPIYTDRGPGGGIALLESYRMTLTGMSEAEAQALFMMSVPQSLIELGMGEKIKIALLKLAAAVSPNRQSIQSKTQQRVYLDSAPWQPANEPAPHLNVLHDAVWQDRNVRIIFRGSFDSRIELDLSPLSLVAKMNTWYLVGRTEGYMRVLKVSDILEVTTLKEGFIREDTFDLIAFWKQWCSDWLERRLQYNVLLNMAPGLISKLNFYLDETIKFEIFDTSASDREGWKNVVITYDNFFQARESILNFGRAAEVLEPEVLRISVIDFARQISEFYSASS